MKITKIKLLLALILIVGFVINGVFITIYNVDKSSNIGMVNSEITKLKIQNNKLTEDISTHDSLTGFLEKSKSVGFNTVEKVLYFNQKDTVAQAR